MIEKLIENPLMRKVLFSRLKNMATENGINAVVLTFPNGEIDAKIYNTPIVVLTEDEFNNIINK